MLLGVNYVPKIQQYKLLKVALKVYNMHDLIENAMNLFFEFAMYARVGWKVSDVNVRIIALINKSQGIQFCIF